MIPTKTIEKLKRLMREREEAEVDAQKAAAKLVAVDRELAAYLEGGDWTRPAGDATETPKPRRTRRKAADGEGVANG
jgi:hypothetical protein